MPPTPRPIPRFIADSPREGIPHGRFAQRLGEVFREACGRIDELPDGVAPPADEQIDWFPDRAWGGRVWVPAAALVDGPDGALEIFGHVSYVQPDDDERNNSHDDDRGEANDSPGGRRSEPHDFRAAADFTGVLAADNPDWRIDLNDDVIGRWRGESDQGGDVTLVWGRPLLAGAVAATADLDGEVADQVALSDKRFTLLALDALKGYGDDLFLQVHLWSRRAQELASESLYD